MSLRRSLPVDFRQPIVCQFGAAIGSGIGLAVGVFLGLAIGAGGSCADCDDQYSLGQTVLITGAVFTGIGAVIGTLVGLSTPRYEWRPAPAAP